ncbi:MAG: hypothetical protein IJU98_08735 [Synergistaceae bacterium]|nr:hypothetical protein [Synergistaceae bacterium]
MKRQTFEKVDGLLHSKLSLTIQYARELAEERGFGKGYGWGKDRISRMVGWESCYRSDGSPERERIREILESSDAYDAAIGQLEAECIKGNERHFEDLDRENEMCLIPLQEFIQQSALSPEERERMDIYAEILSR